LVVRTTHEEHCQVHLDAAIGYLRPVIDWPTLERSPSARLKRDYLTRVQSMAVPESRRLGVRRLTDPERFELRRFNQRCAAYLQR
jgi:hypothetical protein